MLEVDRKKVRNGRAFQSAVTRPSGETIPLLISRKGHPIRVKWMPGIKEIQDALAEASTNMFSYLRLVVQTFLLHFSVFVLDAASLSFFPTIRRMP